MLIIICNYKHSFITLWKQQEVSRDKKDRRIQRAPSFGGFRPFGIQTKLKSEIDFHLEEYEAMKLCDYDRLTHEKAAALMGISRPTFSRVYESARQKLARAMVEVSAIVFNKGNAVLGIEWFRCNNCNIIFSIFPDNLKQCPFCKSEEITPNK